MALRTIAMDEPVYTLREVAEQLKLTRESVLRLLHREEIIGFKAGRDWRVKASELARYMSQRAEIRRRAKPVTDLDTINEEIAPGGICTRMADMDKLDRITDGRDAPPPQPTD